MITGARKLPTHHITIRVPWHDHGWDGTVCKHPADNTSCLVLGRIAEARDDALECKYAGRRFSELSYEQLPPCVDERATVMSAESLVRKKRHPYSENNPDTHGHVKETPLELASYSATAVPFRWMLHREAAAKVAELALAYQADCEPELPFESTWVQEHDNQRVLLDTFFSALKPKESLCFLYAKRTPLADDTRRVIIGVGMVSHVGAPTEYLYDTNKPPLRSSLWERNVGHTIRPDFKNGFLLPYHALLEIAAQDPSLVLSDYVAFAPDEEFESFSYGSELLTHDGAVASLLSVQRALSKLAEVVPGPWKQCQKWVNDQLNRLWVARGPFPGLGSALTACDMERGTLVAYEVARAQQNAKREYSEDPWELIDALVEQPDLLGKELAKDVGAGWVKKWKKLNKQRRSLLQLLSRFNLSADQAKRFFDSALREKAGVAATDAELLANPYLLYERSRHWEDPVAFATVDRGVFPDEVVREKFPLPQPSLLEDGLDERRVRAATVYLLERAAVHDGHTLLPQKWLTLRAAEESWQPGLPLNEDVLSAASDIFEGVIEVVELADGSRAFQLARHKQTRELIAGEVQARLSPKAKAHTSKADWAALVDVEFGVPPTDQDELKIEKQARSEKAAALKTMFESRFSVLVGSAGTGKTSLLKVLCAQPDVEKQGVLLLAPTGKARVRLEQKTAQVGKGQTIAQFLLKLGRYDSATGRYLSGVDAPQADGYGTVVIDECSMLTEDQLAAVLDALVGVKRYVLVGDPRQLPPIGAGRPFVDIIRHVRPSNYETMFPRATRGFAELTIPRRQKGGAREDVVLASWFAGTPLEPAAESVWQRVAAGEVPEVRTVEWATEGELQDKLLNVLVQELGLKGPDDEVGFEVSYGGTVWAAEDGHVHRHAFFNSRFKDKQGAGELAEQWQLLSPVRTGQVGVDALNRTLQARFRSAVRAMATTDKKWRKVPPPMGAQQLLYGDKVINVVNQRRFDVYPKPDGEAYVANGDIGVAVGYYHRSKGGGFHKKLEVEYAAQPGRKFGYWPSDFGDDGASPLELAYVLTVHKTQGSQFKLTFVVLPNPCRLLSRELVYTALTRHEDRLVIFHQRPLTELRQYGHDTYSEIARRLTNLFTPPAPIPIVLAKSSTYLEKNLIHRTERGELVRSKSELVIADKLLSRKVPYQYEHELLLDDGTRLLPDFTIENSQTGDVFYWEHLGMLADPGYQKRWEKKLGSYLANGIKPHAEGGGPNGTLIITQDTLGGALDASAIAEVIDKVILA